MTYPDLKQVRDRLWATGDPLLQDFGRIIDEQLTLNTPVSLEAKLGSRLAFHRSAVDLRDEILRDGAMRHFPTCGPVERARRMSNGLNAYQSDVWPRERTKKECPHPPDTLQAAFWSALWRKDCSLSERQMAFILRQ